MKYLTLETYKDFKCVGSDCPYTCCGGGWGISIDSTTDAFYQLVTGEMGNRLKKGIKREDGKASMILNEKGDCPFLNECGLCDIYIHLGEEHLSETCTNYPRYSYRVGDICFAGVGISCPEVSGFFLDHKEPLMIDFGEDDSAIPNEAKIDWEQFNYAIGIFSSAVDIVQNRELTIKERLGLILVLIDQFQNYCDEGRNPKELINLFSTPSIYEDILHNMPVYEKDCSSKTRFCREVLKYFGNGEKGRKLFPELRDLILFFFHDGSSDLSVETMEYFYWWLDDKEFAIWMENILVYILFKNFMLAFDNRDYYKSVTKGILLILNTIVCVLGLYRVKNGTVPSREYLVMLISHTARIIEHDSVLGDEAWTYFDENNMTELSFMLKLIS